jgi:hypothetical protein
MFRYFFYFFIFLFFSLFFLFLLELYYLSKGSGYSCMYDYVSDLRFGSETGYIFLLPWNYYHIDYIPKLHGVVWYCDGCFCSDYFSTLQCFIDLIIYKWKSLF